MSFLSAVGIMERDIHYPYLHPHQALPQGLPVSYNRWINSYLPDRSACSHKFQVGDKTHSTVSHLDAPMRSVLVHGHGQGAGISHPKNFSSPSTLLGFEGLLSAPDEDKMLSDANPTQYLQQTRRSESRMVPSDQGHRSTPVGVTPNVSMTPVVASSIIVQSASRNRSQQSKRTRKKRAEESSRSSRQPAGMHDALKRPYICDVCDKRYSQPGGVMRHYRAKHNPNSCAYCDARWSRPYQYRDHLEKHHRDVDPDIILGKPASSRRRTKVIGGVRPQNVLPYPAKHDRQSQAVPRSPPPMPPLPAVVKVPQVPLAFSSAEELALPVNDVVDHASRLPRAPPGGFTTASCPSRPVTAHIPFPCLPVGRYYGGRTSGFGPSGFIHPYH